MLRYRNNEHKYKLLLYFKVVWHCRLMFIKGAQCVLLHFAHMPEHDVHTTDEFAQTPSCHHGSHGKHFEHVPIGPLHYSLVLHRRQSVNGSIDKNYWSEVW
jgi:hypothetical protein